MRRRRQPPVTAAGWDDEYRAGKWRRLDDVDEVAHYMVIVGYVLYGPERPSILDVGCGHGRLLELLAPYGYAAYHGLDISTVAIAEAEALQAPTATFEVADFTAWEPARRFDTVVFNESLYLASEPLRVLDRSLEWLNDEGAVIVSMWDHRNVSRIWRAIDGHPRLVVAAEAGVTRGRGRWDVKLLRSRT